MKNWKRLILIALVVALAATLLAGCQSSSSPSSKPSTSPSQAAGGSSPTGGEPQGEPTTVRWISGGDPQSKAEPVMAKINELLLDRYNLQLSFEMYDFGSYEDKINMIISSKEDYDICWTSEGWLNKYLPNINRGAFMALDDLIDQYAPGLKNILPDFLFEQARVNGKIYAIPNYQICYSSFGFAIQKNLVEKYNFDYQSVTKWEDMIPLWDNIVENEPQLYAIGMFNQHYSTKAFTNDYYQPATLEDVKIKMGDPDYRVYWYPEFEKQSRLDVRGWYEKGYIRKDAMTVQDDSADIKSGKYATYMGVVKPGGESERETATGGIEHVQVAIQKPFIGNTSARGTMTAVSSSSKHPEAAIKMIEVMNSDTEIYNMLNFGLEGENYNLVDGCIEEIKDSGYFYNTAWAIGNQFNALLKVGQDPDAWTETDRINRSATVSPINGFSFDGEEVASEIAQISAVVEEYRNIELGDDFEAKFDEYQTKLVLAGIERYCEAVQSQLDAWLTANGKK